MPAKPTELTLIYRRERIRFEDSGVAILECEEPAGVDDSADRLFSDSCGGLNALMLEKATGIIVKCECEPDSLIPGLTYRFFGRWDDHHKHGRQFVAGEPFRVEPHEKAGVIRYLTTICAGHGVGRATAVALWDKFGGQAVRMLREQPDVAAVAVGMQHFTDEKAAAASAVLQEEKATEETTLDLMGIFDGRGLPRRLVKQAIGEWGAKAVDYARKGYPLTRFGGVGFLRADQLYLDNGGRPAALKRQALAAAFTISRDSEGNTWHRPEMIEAGLLGRIGGSEVKAVRALQLAKRAGMVAVCRNGDGVPWIADARKAANERTVAECVRAMLAAPCQWPEVDGLDISEHQGGELAKALRGPVGLFGGSPGTGKTYSAARLIGRIIDLCGHDQIAVCAPTGKAAVRITQALAEYEIEKSATTIHRLLGVESKTAGEGWGFIHHEKNPLPQKYYVLDEASMVDTDLAASFFRALPPGAHLLCVGDVFQLPPVGHGAPLRDLLNAGVPSGSLAEIRRNAGTIVAACKAIREGRPWRYDSELDPDAGQNLVLESTRDNAASLEAIVRTLHRLRGVGIDPVWDTQVLVSVNRKSELSRVEVNKRLQNELNPDGQRVAGCPFRVGDKIIRIKRNSLMPVFDGAGPDDNPDAVDGKVQICNGEQGRVIGVEAKRCFARFDDKCITIPLGRQDKEDDDGNDDGDGENKTTTGCDFDLGYACTVHKFQGSEVPVMLWGLDDSAGAMRLGCRELFYTGVSRGKLFEKHFGTKATADAWCTRRSITKRKTFLAERIKGTVE